MVQVFYVVKCCECSMYQVDMKKASTNKWTCKICNTKQSLKQVFFQGDSAECRSKVQSLSKLKINAEIQNDQKRLEQAMNYSYTDKNIPAQNLAEYNSKTTGEINTNEQNVQNEQNKWAEYLDSDEKEF